MAEWKARQLWMELGHQGAVKPQTHMVATETTQAVPPGLVH